MGDSDAFRQGDTWQSYRVCGEHHIGKEQTNGVLGTNRVCGRETELPEVRRFKEGEMLVRRTYGGDMAAEPLCPGLKKHQSSLSWVAGR